MAMFEIARRFVFGLLVSSIVWAVALARADEPPKPFAWVKGPTEARLGEQAMLTLPEGYAFLGPEEAQRFLQAGGNFPSGAELGIVAPATKDEEWFVVILFVEAGYVSDEDADHWDAEEMLASIKEGTEEANRKRKDRGGEPLIIRGWEEKPHYDKASHKVVWAISAQEKDWIGVNYNTLTLGRHGYLSMNMVGSLDELAKLKPHTATLLTNLNFIEGKRYADFNSATDKVAAVGLGALIAGAAIKSGLLAKLWAFIVPLLILGKKLILLLVLTIAGFLARLFLKKRAPSTPQA
jgi:uncharacterized membrane-anchored protein